MQTLLERLKSCNTKEREVYDCIANAKANDVVTMDYLRGRLVFLNDDLDTMLDYLISKKLITKKDGLYDINYLT